MMKSPSIIYTVQDLSKKSGHSKGNLCWAIQMGFIPVPDYCPKKRKYYTQQRFDAALRALNPVEKEEYVTKARLHVMFGVYPQTLNKYFNLGLLPKADSRKGKQDLFSKKAVEQIKKLLPKLLAEGLPLPKDWYNMSQAAKFLGIPRITFQSWVYGGKIARPTKKSKYHKELFYTEAELLKIKKKKSKYFLIRDAIEKAEDKSAAKKSFTIRRRPA